MKTEVIQPHPDTYIMNDKDRQKAMVEFYDKFGAWYFFNFKKYGGYRKSWLEQYNRELINYRKRK